MHVFFALIIAACFLFLLTINQWKGGMNIQLLDAAHFCENHAKLYFDAKHLEKTLNRD